MGQRPPPAREERPLIPGKTKQLSVGALQEGNGVAAAPALDVSLSLGDGPGSPLTSGPGQAAVALVSS